MGELHVGASPRELVPGDPDAVAGLASRVAVLATGVGNAGAQLAVIQVGEWQGDAADAFDDVNDQQPVLYDKVAVAFTATSAALMAFATVLTDAQDRARLAIDRFEEAAAATERWQRDVSAYRVTEEWAERGVAAAADRLATLDRPPAVDPGGAGRELAELELADARRRVEESGREAARLLDAASEGAPQRPSLVDFVVDVTWHGISEYVAGVVEATVGLGQFAWSVSNVRLIVDHDGWAQSVDELAAGAVYGFEHPVELLKAVVDWETWAESPARALGHLVPGIVLTVLTAGTPAPGSAAARLAETVSRLDQAATVLSRLRDAVLEAEEAGGIPPSLEALDPGPLPGLRPVDRRLLAAVTPVVDLDHITPAPVWRTTHEPLYRADDRPPEIIFEEGFAPRDPTNVDLGDFVEHNTWSAFVSTTRSEQLVFEWGKPYWYHLDCPGGIDVNATLDPHPKASQEEIAFPGGIDERCVVGVQSYDAATTQLGPFIPNPDYERIP